MSFATHARRVRDVDLPLVRRVTALRSCVQLYRPIGFRATLTLLREQVGPYDRDEVALLRAMDLLEASRGAWQAQVRRYAVLRRAAKRRGCRAPHPAEVNPSRATRWYAVDDLVETTDLRRSLDEIEGRVWGPPPADATRLITRAHELRTAPVVSMSTEDLRLLISQRIGLDTLVPVALRRLWASPLAAGHVHEGALLVAVSRVGSEFWTTRPELLVRLRTVLSTLPEPPAVVAAAVESL